ncbi:platelet binding protein GspB-like isoform X2 [Frieseomelitta varia]|uniref:platelet binding protein GspB-like isoform X2 n=1 Tax=Frieseomelitta varia TaxID=561572 RepID=UPI001CB67C8A|nr:platelet binding protein GspB-like isoform X2 [Frieseomelitta varia]
MKLLLLRFAASILLMSVRAGSSPYREIVGVGQSAAPLLVAPVYKVPPAVSLLPAGSIDDAPTIVAGPVTKTIVQGSSSGPVTVVSPATSADCSPTAPETVQKVTVVSAVPEDTVLVKGATAGAVTLVAPSDNSATIANNAASAEAETKKCGVAASAKAAAAIENAEESSATEASSNTAVIGETVGIASANAVIGPSTGPIIIAGPTAPPIPVPVTVHAPTPESVTVDASASAESNVSVTSSVRAERIDDESCLLTDAAESTRIEGSASSSSAVTSSTSGNSKASASASVNLISSAATIALDETPLSNVVVSTGTASPSVVSDPSESVPAGNASPWLLNRPLHHL